MTRYGYRYPAPKVERPCAYCGAPYETILLDAGTRYETPKKYTCSSACRDRDRAWSDWVTRSRVAVVSGDVNKVAPIPSALPPAGKSLGAAIARFAVDAHANCAYCESGEAFEHQPETSGAMDVYDLEQSDVMGMIL
jgi:hypothetical protein